MSGFRVRWIECRLHLSIFGVGCGLGRDVLQRHFLHRHLGRGGMGNRPTMYLLPRERHASRFQAGPVGLVEAPRPMPSFFWALLFIFGECLSLVGGCEVRMRIWMFKKVFGGNKSLFLYLLYVAANSTAEVSD